MQLTEAQLDGITAGAPAAGVSLTVVNGGAQFFGFATAADDFATAAIHATFTASTLILDAFAVVP